MPDNLDYTFGNYIYTPRDSLKQLYKDMGMIDDKPKKYKKVYRLQLIHAKVNKALNTIFMDIHKDPDEVNIKLLQFLKHIEFYVLRL